MLEAGRARCRRRVEPAGGEVCQGMVWVWVWVGYAMACSVLYCAALLRCTTMYCETMRCDVMRCDSKWKLQQARRRWRSRREGDAARWLTPRCRSTMDGYGSTAVQEAAGRCREEQAPGQGKGRQDKTNAREKNGKGSQPVSQSVLVCLFRTVLYGMYLCGCTVLGADRRVQKLREVSGCANVPTRVD